MKGRSIGMILLAVYLILAGLVALFALTFAGLPMLMGVIALLAGIAILIGR
ncbi:MAG TPA: hypothetical protein VKY89_20430 [Thermoanaerobaculia bacterium]|jgi:hypothetical protein|nr:hypothetical protein [Thermoanaerobaculia bacterium]